MLVKEKSQLSGTQTIDQLYFSTQLALVQFNDTIENKNHFKQKQISQHVTLNVPITISYLHITKSGNLDLCEKQTQTGAAFILEPVYLRNRHSLLIVCMKKHSVWINGRLAPRVAVAHENDEIFFEHSESVFQVSLNNNDRIGLCPKVKVGKRCPICRKEFDVNSIIYLCHCGLAVHAEKHQFNNEEQTCVNLISECLDCGRVVELN